MIVRTTIIVSFLLAVLMKPAIGEAQPCTLCEGSDTIPNPFESIGKRTCLDASLEALFYDESSEFCKGMRNLAKYVCGCEEKPKEEQVDKEDKTDEEQVDNKDEKEEDKEVDKDEEQVDNKDEKEKEPPTSGVEQEITNSPTSLIDKKPNCQDLISGIYPFDESYANSLEIQYRAELMIDNQYNIYSQENEDVVLDKDIIKKFEDAASRLVSAGAAGCFDRRRRQLGRTYQIRSLLRTMEADDNKIHYVKFFDLVERSEASCSRSNRKDVTSTCFAVEGKINVIYSSLLPTNNNNNNTNEEWAEDLILDIFTTQSSSISYVVQEVTNYNSVQSEFGPEPSASTSSSSKSLAIGLGVGLSAFALIASLFMYLFMKRRSSYTNLQKRTQRRARKFEKKIERVKIITDRRHGNNSSDDANSFVEYVDTEFINADGSVSNAPTEEWKRVFSFETSVLSKTQSYDDSREIGSQELMASEKSSSSNDSSSGTRSNSRKNEKDVEEGNIENEMNTLRAFPLCSFDIEDQSNYSEITPYDEALSYMTSSVANASVPSQQTEQRTSPSVNGNNPNDKSVKFISEEDQIVQIKDVRQEFHC